MTGTEIVATEGSTLATTDDLTVDDLVAQVQLIQEVMKRVMHKDEHYGTIPGTPKPTLYKPGAEKLCKTFKLAPTYPAKELTWHEDGHLTALITCRLSHIPTGLLVAEGEGLCSTKESKYAYRKGDRLCPECGEPYILKSKKDGGWFCWSNPSRDKHGCGAQFAKDDPRITDQEVGRRPNPDLADSYNTVLKMGAKRALIAAVLNGTAASDIFSQDLEDTAAPPPVQEAEVVREPEPPARSPLPEWLIELSRDFTEREIIGHADAIRAEKGHTKVIDSLLLVAGKFQSSAAVTELINSVRGAAAREGSQTGSAPAEPPTGEGTPDEAGGPSEAPPGEGKGPAPAHPEDAESEVQGGGMAPSTPAPQQGLDGGPEDQGGGHDSGRARKPSEASAPVESPTDEQREALDILEQAIAAKVTAKSKKLTLDRVRSRANTIAIRDSIPTDNGFDKLSDLAPVAVELVEYYELREVVGA